MKIFEILESVHESNDYSKNYRDQYINAIDNFDLIVNHHGTEGANVIFDKIINVTKDTYIDFTISQDESYTEMIEARNKLEEKIKNSNGLSY